MKLPAAGQPINLRQSKGGRSYRTGIAQRLRQGLDESSFATAQVAYQLNYFTAAKQPGQPCGELGGILWPGR